MRRLAVIALCIAASGCTRSDMDSQPKYYEYEPGALFRDGRVLQSPVPGTVARDEPVDAAAATQKPAVTAALLAQGRKQYVVFCSPCHDRVGGGRGIVVERGMPQPPSFHEQKLREADDRHFYDVITDGTGAMYSFADLISPQDRWAIVAYVRALQLSQHAAVADLPVKAREKLMAETTP
ncbi:MAG TPA: cytochrome c [Pseudolabrys sp.]|jgi:mono/diheme cytochrome c family protein|nr:cytochrome c [Pseudolabrys sp.]